MRLTKIKLAGFKTFVDPTTLSFPSNLTGVIGPNGCGKSNIVDAIRWVMGEASAKNLRGDSMEDVIFSGSSSRAPVGKANVELYFDNSTNTLDLKFAKFNEIVIRREVSRDGVSDYFLNNTRCRRKDIREVFLGTGLGPRSYAIIEQGMISRLVESKPDELRTYLEEAAGISKYKEKRRETEIKLKHTKDNLSRLNDVMKEINSQLGKLQRQATAANSYKEYKAKERKLRLDIIALKWKQFDIDILDIEKDISKKNIEKEKNKAELSNRDRLIEEEKQKRDNEQEKFNKVQSDFYHIGSEIAKCEKDIEHSQETESSRKSRLDEINSSFDEIVKLENENKEKSENINREIEKKNQELIEANKKVKEFTEEKEKSSFALQNWQTKFNDFLTKQSETVKKHEIEKTKIESYQKSIDALSRRLKILKSDTNLERNEKFNEKSVVLTDASDIKEKLSAILIDFERLKLSKEESNKTLLQIPKSISIIIQKFKLLFDQIKLLVRSQQEEIDDIKIKIKEYEKLLEEAKHNSEEFQSQIETDKQLKIKMEKEKIELKQLTDKIIWEFDENQNKLNNINISISTLKTEQSSLTSNIDRYIEEKKNIDSRKQKILSEVNIPKTASGEMQEKLKDLLIDKNEKESELTAARDNLALSDKKMQDFELEKQTINTTISEISQELENRKILLSEKSAQRNSLKENIEVPVGEIEKAISSVDASLNIDDLEKDLEKTKTKADNLGAINLAAIDELKEQEERKKYLDKQYDDLSKSVSTLESAIKKIDNDTKSKFKDMFDQINKNLQYFFPKIFGGGTAYLEMNEKDLLNTGITIKARPPGKLVKNISLLSGGEKAGTGTAFVFSIFKINPAPFCLLDEVDAPLDEGNNSRFCTMVKEMSDQVQFIFITHNKSTMELADVLSGVTMREAGVSKLVSVNVKEAIEMNAEQKISQSSRQ